MNSDIEFKKILEILDKKGVRMIIQTNYRIILAFFSIFFILTAYANTTAQLSPDKILEIANQSKKYWKIGDIREKKDKVEVQILMDSKEISKLKFPYFILNNIELEDAINSTKFETPILKEKKGRLIYEIPVIFNNLEVGKIIVDPYTGEIKSKGEKEEKPKEKRVKLKGGSPLGHAIGILGTILIVFSQIYSIRRRDLISFGSKKSWLKLHFYFGILGAVLVLIHAGFPYEFKFLEIKKGSLGVLTAYLMIIVVSSGFVGKFLQNKRYFKAWRKLHAQLVTLLFALIFLHIILTFGED